MIGGPEVSFETKEQRIVSLADHVVTGQGDVTFNKLARALLHGPRPLMKVHVGEEFELDDLTPPTSTTATKILRRHLSRRGLARLPVQMRVLSVGAGQDGAVVRHPTLSR